MKKLNETTTWTALVTPMQEDGALDLDDLASLIHRQDEAGNGILILGSTGEGLALGLEDKKKVVKTASALSIKVPLMVGVGGFNLRSQLEWMEDCQQYPIDSFLLVTPLYSKPDEKGQIAWFEALLNAADRPCMLYNVPSRTGVHLQPGVLMALQDHPNLFALKEASGSIEKYQQYRKAAPDLPVYSGDDSLMPFFPAAGCQGLVSVMANVWPKATHRYVEWCRAGRGRELLPMWKECSDILFTASNPIPVKKLLKQKGWIKTDALRLPLTAADLQAMEPLLQSNKKIEHWLQKTDDIDT